MRRASALVPLVVLCACGGSGPTGPVAPPATATTTPPAAPPVASAAPAKPAYPPTDKRPVTDAYHGTQIVDDYRWLEDWSDPAVKQWTEAQSAFARNWLDEVPSRAAIRARLEQLVGDTSPSWHSVAARKGTVFALERRPPKQQPFLVVLRSLDDTGSERVLVDPNAIDPQGGASIGWFVPSLDGKKVAVALSRGGAESGDIHVYDAASGKEAGDVVPQADGSGDGDCFAWKADGSGFYYTGGAHPGDRPPGNHDYQRIYFHLLGKPVSSDRAVVGSDSPKIAQWQLDASRDGRTILARMQYGDGGEFDQWLLGPSGKWTKVASRADGVKRMRVGPGGALYLLSTQGASRGKVLRTSVAAPSLARAETVVPEGEAVIGDLVPTASRLVLVERIGGPSRVRVLPLDGGKDKSKGDAASREASKGASKDPSTILATPPVSDVAQIVPLDGDEIAFEVVSYTEPPAWYRANARDGAVARTALAARSAADFRGVEVLRETCTSKDGTPVPLSVLRPTGAPADGARPTILTGYGGFGVSSAPRFGPFVLAWLEQGGIYAVANIRGGGEFGEDWHHAGNLERKQNVFDDFYGCAQHLVQAGYTKREKLAIWGRSNGGLLMGAELTQHPDAFEAVVAQVGIFDMLRVERDSNGAFNATEYGSVNDPAQFAALHAYSPYQHVQDGVAYPATLFMTGANDPRVNPYHSRKMVARLQAATSSDAPILLRTSANTGHGFGTPLDAQIEELTDIYGFLFRQLGVMYVAK